MEISLTDEYIDQSTPINSEQIAGNARSTVDNAPDSEIQAQCLNKEGGSISMHIHNSFALVCLLLLTGCAASFHVNEVSIQTPGKSLEIKGNEISIGASTDKRGF